MNIGIKPIQLGPNNAVADEQEGRILFRNSVSKDFFDNLDPDDQVVFAQRVGAYERYLRNQAYNPARKLRKSIHAVVAWNFFKSAGVHQLFRLPCPSNLEP